MTEINNKWQELYSALQPKEPLFCPEEPSLTQKVFLKTNGLEALFGGSAGGGKAAPLDTLIPTPSGFKLLKDIHPGDYIFGRDGKPYMVLAESPVWKLPGWRFTFDDGSTVDSNNEHLWLTFDAKELHQLTTRTPEWREARRNRRPSRAKSNPSKGAYHQSVVIERNQTREYEYLPPPTGTVRTTKEIVETLTVRNGRANHAIPVAAPLVLPERDLPIDPYVLGAWLGDGFSASGRICGMDDEIFLQVEKHFDLTTSKPDPNLGGGKFRTNYYEQLHKALKHEGLLGFKHVPEEYLWASEEQRLALLQGLMDTDGNVSGSSVEFVNTNRELTEAVAHLARSLGMKVRVREGRAKLNGKDYGPKWVVKFTPNRIVFRLPRKADIQKIATRRTTQFRYITKAEPIEAVEMKCLKVASPDELFLVTEDLIPTHNSSALLMAALQYVDVPDYTAILFRRTFADLALPGAVMDRLVSWISEYDEVRWNANNFVATFPSGARIAFGYLNNVNDKLRYKCCAVGTEVLTQQGWMPIEKIHEGDMVMSMDPETRKISYQPVVRTFEYDYDGEMVETKPGSDVAFCVTPNHRVLHSTQRSNRLKFTHADELPATAKIPQTGIWDGVEPTPMEFPAGTRGNSLVFDPYDWAEFLGWYLAEGDSGEWGGRYGIRISQTKKYEKNRQRIIALLERAGANVHVSDGAITINNKALCEYLSYLGHGASRKMIPLDAFSYDSEFAQRLIDALVEGDGTWRDPDHKSGHFVTTSPDLADGIMQLAANCGYRTTLLEQEYDEKHHFKAEGVAYHVFLLRKESDTAIQTRRVPYSGKVYSLEVAPFHTYMIRYNGRVSFTGNSAEFQFCGMDEVTEIREADYRYLFSRLRRPKAGPLSEVPLRMRAASNPAPNWVRQRFIVEGEAKGRIFVRSSLHDNPGIDQASYERSLEELDWVERQRLQHGDWWAVEAGSMFKRENFEIIGSDELPTLTKPRLVRFWDLAATKPSETNPDPDWTVGVLMMEENGIFYILDVRRIRDEAHVVEKYIKDTAKEDGPHVAIRMEQEPGSSGKALGDYYARHVLVGYDFGYGRETGDKETKARPLKSASDNGNVRLVRGPWISDFLDEITAFPEGGGHDDQVDAAAGAFNDLTGLGKKLKSKVRLIV